MDDTRDELRNRIREELPEDFQRAEQLVKHGMVDMVVQRSNLRDTLIRITGLLMRPGPAAEIVALDKSALDIPRHGAAKAGAPGGKPGSTPNGA